MTAPKLRRSSPEPHLLTWRMDAFQVAFRVGVHPRVQLELRRAHELARKVGAAPFFVGTSPIREVQNVDMSAMERAALEAEAELASWGEERLATSAAFQLKSSRSESGKLLMTNADMTIHVGPDQHGFDIVVQASAVYLATHEPAAVLAYMRTLVLNLTGGVHGCEQRARRLDVCADATHVSFGPADRDAFIRRSIKSATWFTIPQSKAEWARRTPDGTCFTGFGLGSRGSSIYVRLYNKTEELMSQHGIDAEKTRTELAAYAAAGWDGRSPVWRLEAELTSESLHALRIGETAGAVNMRDPDAAIANLDRLWKYIFGSPDATGGCLRLALPGSAPRRDRWKTDPRFVAYQKAFVCNETAPLSRVRGHRGGANMKTALGTLLSHLRGNGRLASVFRGQPTRADIERRLLELVHRELFEPLSDEELVTLIQAHASRTFSRTDEARSVDLQAERVDLTGRIVALR